MNKALNEAVNKAVNKPKNKAVNKAVNEEMDESEDSSMNQTNNQSIDWSSRGWLCGERPKTTAVTCCLKPWDGMDPFNDIGLLERAAAFEA